ncbi:MAG TPA: nucleoside-diphosphate sugar epimerase [Gammaproteobacteria bacterium]|nr:nucleoside-diphosphate sugar epimerase [Gammaproteobacteria bacterium]
MQNEPRIWLLIGDKPGDNAQVKKVADTLALPCDTRQVFPKPQYVLGKPKYRVSLSHLDMERSATLAAPWPDLIITIGRRPSMAALWVKQQNPATKIVLLGRPRRWIEKFDLVITLPQYQVPQLPNVLRLSLPIMRSDPQAVAAASASWKSRLDSLPKPLTAVLVGGATRPFRFDAEVTRKLVEQCRALQAQDGGTLYFSTSRRTAPEITATLKAQLPQGAQLYTWQQDDGDNPYLALLGLADRCIVTGDSISMLVEVADQRKPLAIFALPQGLQGRLWQGIMRRLHAAPAPGLANRLLRALGRVLYSTGIAGFTRDLTQVHSTLIENGLAVYLGTPFTQPASTLPDELAQIRQRIMALLPLS